MESAEMRSLRPEVRLSALYTRIDYYFKLSPQSLSLVHLLVKGVGGWRCVGRGAIQPEREVESCKLAVFIDVVLNRVADKVTDVSRPGVEL